MALVWIDADGFHRADFSEILKFLQDGAKAIYGADVYLEPDSQDGQLLGLVAGIADEAFKALELDYSSKSPATAIGDALSRNVKINGVRRFVPTNSTVDVLLVGQNGTVITNGQVEDTNGQRWALPASVTIGIDGQILVTATATKVGAIPAQANTVTKIATPTRGWQTVNNALPAVEGDPVQTDAELRALQSESTMIPSLSVLEGITGAVASVNGVRRHRVYENDTNQTDGDGIPGHTIAAVVEGGDATAIATAIHRKKTPGTGTWAPDFAHRPNEFDGSSLTSLTIETGTKVFTTQADLLWVAGMRLRAADVDDHDNFMEGTVTSYVGTTLTLEVDTIGGAGTDDHWLIGLSFPGGTTVTVPDQYGVPTEIDFIRPTPVTITVEVSITTLAGFVSATRDVIESAIADYINGLRIGDDIMRNRLFTPANLGNVGQGATYYVDGIRISRTGEGDLDTDNLEIAFNEIPVCSLPDDVLVVDSPVP